MYGIPELQEVPWETSTSLSPTPPRTTNPSSDFNIYGEDRHKVNGLVSEPKWIDVSSTDPLQGNDVSVLLFFYSNSLLHRNEDNVVGVLQSRKGRIGVYRFVIESP